MVERLNGVVLRTVKYSDTLMIADMYTQSYGRISFLVPVSRSKRSRVRSVLFQPLSMLSFTANVRQGKALTRLSDVQPYTMFSSLPYDVSKSSVAVYLAEFLSYVLREDDEHEALFAFMDYAFHWFDEAQSGYSAFHIVFLLKLTAFLGIYPNVENYKKGDCFDLVAGCLVDEPPVHSQYLSSQDTGNFIELLNVDFSSLHTITMNRKARGEYLALINTYYKLHIPDFPELKSEEVLRELFS
ncbi:MAG: DNA repair protein RecO [Bacteroidaceae bacterium]|nr:DNA repair protein RecO [Bacteroidaceae bacterium]